MESAFFRYNEDFTLFGAQHLVMLSLTAVIGVLLPLAAHRYWDVRQKLQAARLLALCLALAVLGWTGIRIALGDFDYTADLPLDICNVVALALPLLMWRPKYRVHEILYFWILAGTIQAVITPHLYDGFPHFTFIKYWVVHSGLVIYAVYITVAYRFYPGWKSLWRAFGYLQLYVLSVLILNLLLGSNYVYLLSKPPTASPLDYLGPWPWYLLVAEGLALFLFALMLLPFAGKLQRSNQEHALAGQPE
ncbi:MAG: TIGR02206 family membrane protein [Phaeodactylibacter sp.]|nr:TIGR02206 family membrane protein [Phaeodactylibacter sp.]MCB9275468.1 TIGR02206 family membrane protein [Lewinellaceae bacterium]